MIAEIPFDSTPEELDEIELTMEFLQENAKVASRFNNILNKGFLCLKIRLKDARCTASFASGMHFWH
jgi:hypothetical protein